MYLLIPVGMLSLGWAIYRFPTDKFGAGMAALSVVTVFLSGYLRIDLPKTKLHLTISDALVFLSLLFYGGGLAVVLAMLEAGFSSLKLSSGNPFRSFVNKRTLVINVLIAGFSTFSTAFVVEVLFGSPAVILQDGSTGQLLYLLTAMAVTQFIANTSLASAYIAARSERSMFEVWNEHCFNALTLFFAGAFVAGISAKAAQQTDMVQFAIALSFFGLVYITYRRYTNDVHRASSEAEQSEAKRVEQAEAHISELNHYVTELRKTAEELSQSRESFRHAAFHDSLTGLPNRSHVLESIREQLGSGKQDSKFAVLLLNLDRFRTINESLGYQTGDRVLRHLAKRLSGIVRPNDLVGHFGGDDFAVVLPNIDKPEVAFSFAERVIQTVAEAIRFKDRQVYTNASIGIVVSGPEYTKAEDLLRDADIAMRNAKDGTKGWMQFDSSMHARAVRRQTIETDLRYAIVCNELEVFYQPIVDLRTLQLHGFEALVRWNHPEKGLVGPNEFIPVSEDTGLVIPMTLQILRSACSQLVEWQTGSLDEDRKLMVSVNLSGMHLSDPQLVGQVQEIISETGIEPSRLKLEITESAAMDDAEKAIEKLKQIKQLGVKLSMDDFGTGYSSLSYLRKFPVNTLKIDRSFVSGMEEAAENDEIVQTIMALAKSLKLNVIAEGIENTQQLANLRALGCELGQGYLFSPPVPVSAATEIVKDRGRWLSFLGEMPIQPPGENDFSGLQFPN